MGDLVREGQQFGLEQSEQALQDVLVVLPVPEAAQVAGWILQLIERRVEVRRVGYLKSEAT